MPAVFVMVMPMIVPVLVRAIMSMPVVMVMQPLPWPRAARVLAEDQRLDRDRHRVRRQADAAEVDVVEVRQDDAVDDKDLARDLEFFPQDRAEGLRHVAVEHDEQRLARRDAVCEAAADAGG